MEEPWLVVAKALPCGAHTKIVCCASSNSMIVSHLERGYHGHCFKCKADLWHPHGYRGINEIKRHRAELAMMASKEPTLPRDFTLDIPPADAVWLYKYGISPEEAHKHGIGYSKFFDRIVFPVYDMQNKLVCVQMRALRAGQSPKYLNSKSTKSGGEMFWTRRTNNKLVVVTEDILSAIKIGRQYDAVSSLGSDLGDVRASLLTDYETVIIWYDNDRAGKLGALDAERQLILQGVSFIGRVKSLYDPKDYDNTAIRDYVERVTC